MSRPIPLLLTLFLSFGCVGELPPIRDTGTDVPPDDEPGDDSQTGDGTDDVEPSNDPPASGAVFVLAHGFSGSAESFSPQIEAGIESDGHSVLRTQVPAIAGSRQRAAVLGQQIDTLLAQTGASEVHIIAHSQGGLDSRILISQLGYADKVASLTTISTPHRGTRLADAALGLLEDIDGSDALGLFIALAAGDTDNLEAALVDLSESNAPQFNAQNPDAPGVFYQSYAGLSTVGGFSNDRASQACATSPATAVPPPDTLRALLVGLAPILAESSLDREPHDGVVAVQSARYANFRGCLAADHLDETGILADETSSIDTIALYRQIANELAAPATIP